MWYFIVILIIAVIGAAYIGGVFFKLAIEILLNGPLLYLVYCRVTAHLIKSNKGVEYAIGLLISGLIFVVAYGFFITLPFWPITIYIVMAYLIAELLIWQEAKEWALEKISKKQENAYKRNK